MQLECDGFSASIGYLEIEMRRTIIMLKICLNRQKIEKNILVNEINTISSVNLTNSLVETNRKEKKSTSISGRRNEYGDSEKRTDLEQKRIYTSSLQCSPLSKLTIQEKSVKFKNKCIN